MTELEIAYRNRILILEPLAKNLEEHLANHLRGLPRIDRISSRVKSVKRFMQKAQITQNEQTKYVEPLNQIQDQLGVRIITHYLQDIEKISTAVEKYYRQIESKTIVPDSEWKFGYFGRHYILLIPTDIIEPSTDTNMIPSFFELQIKSLFQHAWSEANHDLGYDQTQFPLDQDSLRRLAFTSAQAWGADRIFNELLLERDARKNDSAPS